MDRQEDKRQWRNIEEELGLFLHDDEINDQSEKNDYSYERENQDWKRIEEMPDYITTKSGIKLKNTAKIAMMRDFNK